MKYKRLKAVTRYKVVAGPGQPVQYATVYYFATQKALGAFGPSKERAAAVKEMEGTWGDKIKIVGRQQWEQLKAWER